MGRPQRCNSNQKDVAAKAQLAMNRHNAHQERPALGGDSRVHTSRAPTCASRCE